MATTCPSCGGAGSTVAPGDSCNTCDGVGRVRGRKEVEIDLPAGVDDGFRIRKDGFGDVPLSGAGTPGSLYVRIHVAPSRVWRRQGSTLFFPATIPFHTAVLGWQGACAYSRWSSRSSSASRYPGRRGDDLAGRGVPSPTRRGQKGDLMVQFEVSMPRSLTKRQREILQQYADEVEGRTTTPPANDSSSSTAPKPSQSASSPSASSAASDSAQKASAKPTSKKTSSGRFSIHPSSRSDEADNATASSASASPTSASASASAPKSASTSSGPKYVRFSSAESKDASSASKAASDDSQKGFLGRAWDWMTSKK